ncbi:MAG: hypothetical protein N2201_07560, partial [candidate division WOR-3 bacterium]|nr:hypothetical protein [candidate division WOR-3 bacterium]
NDLYVQSQVGIVDLDKVVPSHFFIITPDQVKVEENPRFPQTLQNRNFAQGVLFYREKLKKIDFFQLTSDSITPAWGVPTLMSIDGQLCVVAGNLRYNLLAEIYKNDEWTQSYKNHLQEYLKLHNINFDLSRIEKPILVKMVTQPLSPQEIVAFCYFANKVDVRYVGIM